MRSCWKLNLGHNYTVQKKLVNKIVNLDRVNNKSYGSFSKRMLISKSMVGREINVYNGKITVRLKLQNYMISHHVGSFVLTKKITSAIHTKSKKITKGRMRFKKIKK